jgi:hypothetical protein
MKPLSRNQLEAQAQARRRAFRLIKSSGQPPQSTPMPETVPICDFHGKMKRRKDGTWFCPHKMRDGSYCDL